MVATSLLDRRDSTTDNGAGQAVAAPAAADSQSPSAVDPDYKKAGSTAGPRLVAAGTSAAVHDAPARAAGAPPGPSPRASCPTLLASLATCTPRTWSRSTFPNLAPRVPESMKCSVVYFCSRCESNLSSSRQLLPGRRGFPRSRSPRSSASGRRGYPAGCGTDAPRRCFRCSLRPRTLTNEESCQGIRLVAGRFASTRHDSDSCHIGVAWINLRQAYRRAWVSRTVSGETHASSDCVFMLYTNAVRTLHDSPSASVRAVFAVVRQTKGSCRGASLSERACKHN